MKKVSDMVDSALIVIEGQSRSPDDLIEVIAKKFYSKKENSEEENTKQILNVGVYLPCVRYFVFFFNRESIFLVIYISFKTKINS